MKVRLLASCFALPVVLALSGCSDADAPKAPVNVAPGKADVIDPLKDTTKKEKGGKAVSKPGASGVD